MRLKGKPFVTSYFNNHRPLVTSERSVRTLSAPIHSSVCNTFMFGDISFKCRPILLLHTPTL